jgi:hypothetical protein
MTAGPRVSVDGRRCLRVSIKSDADAAVLLSLRFPRGARAERGRRCPTGPGRPRRRARAVTFGRRSALFLAGPGHRDYVIYTR